MAKKSVRSQVPDKMMGGAVRVSFNGDRVWKMPSGEMLKTRKDVALFLARKTPTKHLTDEELAAGVIPQPDVIMSEEPAPTLSE